MQRRAAKDGYEESRYKGPETVPRDNRYFLHDDRQADDEGKEEDDEEKKEDKKEKREERRGDKPSPDDEGKWLHDKYFELLEEKPRAKAPLGWSRGQDGDHGDWYSSDSRQGRARTLKTWMPKMPESKDQWEEDWEDDNKWRGKKWTSEKYDSYDRYDKRDKGKSGKNSKYDDYDEYDASESWERDRKGGSNGKDAWSGWSAGGGKSSGKGRRREEEWEDEEEWHDDRWHASSSKNGYSNGRSKGGHSRRDEGDDWDKKRGYDDYDYDYDYEEDQGWRKRDHGDRSGRDDGRRRGSWREDREEEPRPSRRGVTRYSQMTF